MMNQVQANRQTGTTDTLYNQAETLHGLLNSLEERIYPALDPMPPTPAAGGGTSSAQPERPTLTGACRRFDYLIDRLQQLSTRINL